MYGELLASAERGREEPVQSVRDVPGPYFLFSVSSPKIHLTPTPPYLWKSFFDPFIPCNFPIINSLHFSNVNESVTANPLFCPFLAPKSALLPPKWPLFRQKIAPKHSSEAVLAVLLTRQRVNG
jgi:hypothetical protein